ncbi:MAG: hypothetical protein RDU41_09560 [Clostridia bacterium]|nr:hypothetical protein [Clostridia bacterium]
MALAADRNYKRKDGQLIAFLIAANVIIYKGALACVNAAGYAVPGDDAAGYQFAGVAYGQVDNLGGANGAKAVLLEQVGTFEVTLAGANQASVGKEAYLTDDATVTLTAPANPVKVGRVVELVRANTVRIKIDGYTAIASDTTALVAAVGAQASADALANYLKNYVPSGILVGAPGTASTHADGDAFDFNVNISTGIVAVNGVLAQVAAQTDFDVDNGAESPIGDTDSDIIYTIVAAEADGIITLVTVPGAAAPAETVETPTAAEIAAAVGHANWIRIGNTQLHRSGAAAVTQTYDNAVRPVLA